MSFAGGNMAFDFTPSGPVLNFGPRHHARWSSRQFVLWPAWAYRVVAPRVRQRNLNVLQRATMGLCRAGLVDTEAIAENLSIHRDLAAFIVAELMGFGLLDNHGLPTEHGIRLLEEDSLETQELVAGYVFQDPWNGDLWPRFVESLEYCELEYNDDGFPLLVLGSIGKPRSYRAFTVLPRSNEMPATPSASAVVEAVARHRKGLRFKDAEEDDDDEESIGGFVASGIQIRRVSLVEEEPQPVFLATYLYVPQSVERAMDWYACDPFGLGQSVRLRRRLEVVIRDDPGLFGVVNQLIGRTQHAGYEDQKRWLESIQLTAGLEVDRRLTVNVRDDPSFDLLLAMESARQEMNALGPGCPQRKISEVLRSGVKVLEAVFSSMAGAHPLGDIWKRVYATRVGRHTGRSWLVQQQDGALLTAIYGGAIRAVGFAEPIPRSFLNVKPGQIRSVAEYGAHWRLRPLVSATVLLAGRDPSHPLRRVAQEDPRLLVTVDSIATVGGGAGHAGGRTVSREEAEGHVDRVYEVVATLLELESKRDQVTTESSGGTHG